VGRTASFINSDRPPVQKAHRAYEPTLCQMTQAYLTLNRIKGCYGQAATEPPNRFFTFFSQNKKSHIACDVGIFRIMRMTYMNAKLENYDPLNLWASSCAEAGKYRQKELGDFTPPCSISSDHRVSTRVADHHLASRFARLSSLNSPSCPSANLTEFGKLYVFVNFE